jgi:hypothetical protein
MHPQPQLSSLLSGIERTNHVLNEIAHGYVVDTRYAAAPVLAVFAVPASVRQHDERTRIAERE